MFSRVKSQDPMHHVNASNDQNSRDELTDWISFCLSYCFTIKPYAIRGKVVKRGDKTEKAKKLQMVQNQQYVKEITHFAIFLNQGNKETRVSCNRRWCGKEHFYTSHIRTNPDKFINNRWLNSTVCEKNSNICYFVQSGRYRIRYIL